MTVVENEGKGMSVSIKAKACPIDPSTVDPPAVNPADRSTKIRNQQEVFSFLAPSIDVDA